MSKSVKIWLATAAFLVIVGLIIFIAAMTACNWDFTKLGTVKYETNTYELSEEFSSISIKTDTADIVFLTSDDEKCKVVCYEDKNAKHSASVQDGTLVIKIVDMRRWYDYIGINFGTQKITVYLPESKYDELTVKESTGDIEIPKDFEFESIDISVSTGDVNNCASASGKIKIKTSTGDINIENVSADMLDLSVSTGKVNAKSITCEGDIKIKVSTGDAKLTDILCKVFSSDGSTGDISLKNVIATEKLSIERSTGNVKLDGSDAAEIFIKTDTGNVKGSLLSDKVFFVETDTGNIDIPKTMTGGRCEITTDTGNIKIEID